MVRSRPAAGGGTVVEIESGRLVGWVNRFSGRNGGIPTVTAGLGAVTVVAGNGATAIIAVPFGPMALGADEPVEALLRHLDSLRPIGLILVRAKAFSVGICAAGKVVTSSTDTRYVQGRTAAGGWSQQRYARRRGNQLHASWIAAADAAVRVLDPGTTKVRALVLGGDATGVHAVLADPRLAWCKDLPQRMFGDIGEPRRAVLDEVAGRSLSVEITVRDVG